MAGSDGRKVKKYPSTRVEISGFIAKADIRENMALISVADNFLERN